MNVATAIFSGTLEDFQHSTRLILENQSYHDNFEKLQCIIDY